MFNLFRGVMTMARQYSMTTVFRMVTNELLQQFFVQLENPCYSMDWERRPRRNVESALQCMNYFSRSQFAAAELILRQVFELASQTGVQSIRAAASLLEGETFLRQMPADMNPYCLAMWTWLNAPRVFEQAHLLHEVENLSWWSKRDDLPDVEPRVDSDTLEWFAQDVSRILEQKQGRGRHCTIEHFKGDAGIDYFFCFPDDYAKTVTLHNKRGELVTKTLRQTFEIVFAYSRREGTLELSARLGQRIKQKLEESFSWMILEEQIGPRVPKQLYNLNRLKERHFQLETDPSDQVHVQLRQLRFDLPDHAHTIVLEAKPGTRDDMQQTVEKCLNTENLCLDELNISMAQFQFRFGRTTERGRRTMTFNIRTPDRCSLRRQRSEWVSIAQKHLRMWRISR